jgi:hypothetical protein
VPAGQPEVRSAVPDDEREHPLLRSIEVAHHTISTLPHADDANLSIHCLAPECFVAKIPHVADHGSGIYDSSVSISGGGGD